MADADLDDLLDGALDDVAWGEGGGGGGGAGEDEDMYGSDGDEVQCGTPRRSN